MKKICYLLAFVALAFTSCQKQPIIQMGAYTKAMTFTLAATDYQLLPSTDYPYSSLSFNSVTDANTYVPQILSLKEPQLGNGSSAAVTFTIAPASVKVADSLYSHVSYTVTSADYVAVTGNNYGDFNASDVLNFLVYKYPHPAANQLAVISYTLYTGSDNSVVNSFLYLNGAWQKIYQVSPAQYAAVGDGAYNNFSSGEISNLPGYFNAFLKADISIADTARVNDVEYVSYQIYTGSTYQKVLALTYDGNNWGYISTTATLAYLKTGGVWTPNQTIYHTLTSDDIKLIANSTIGTASQRTNLGKYGDFSGWAPADLNSAFILVLTTDYPNPKVNIDYVVTYLLYTGGSDVSTKVTFQYNGTTWVAK
ncbi:MAG TPA: hypothetical protein VK671_10505 [Mucilaginibacter sp.]|jgi:hypothetical protein|nr:hypothetical protein [Mucilaginibacter sp.]